MKQEHVFALIIEDGTLNTCIPLFQTNGFKLVSFVNTFFTVSFHLLVDFHKCSTMVNWLSNARLHIGLRSRALELMTIFERIHFYETP